MKIALISGFTDAEVRENLTFSKNTRLFQGLIKLFRLPARVGEFSDLCPWVKSMILYFEKCQDVELHVIGSHIRLKNVIEEFQMRGINYHYYRQDYSSFIRIIGNYKIWKRLQLCGRRVKRIVNNINPDIVLLSGSENPVSSVSVLSLPNYPRLCLCQVVYNDPERQHPNKLIKDCESDVFSSLDYLGVYCKKHYKLLQQQYNEKKIFKYNYPPRINNRPPISTSIEKEYDFVNFAFNHSSAKGTPDSIQALAIVKHTHPDVTLNIVGGCSESLRKELDVLIEELHLQQNVIFTPFFEKRSDVLQHIRKARFAVLPCKLDNISGTMLQALTRGLPIVVYETTGTPELNKYGTCALIAKMNDVDGLAKQMMSLLEDNRFAEEMKINARRYREQERLTNKKNWDKMVDNFQAIIDNHYKGLPISKDKLFNPLIDD